MDSKNTRLLAAVMFTDIEGYTAMMQEDEAKANIQSKRHREVLEKRATEFDGQILHFLGDGALTIFKSAHNAVMCSINVQRDLANPRLPLRVGIHIGDIAYGKDDVFGDAVNIAARLESLSPPGGILISDKVVEEVKNHRQIKTTALGTYALKNVRQPMQIHSVSNEGIKIPLLREIKAKSKGVKNSVAVLPFVNMSEELGFDYFSDGLTEEIINGLTKIEQLDVISRTSAFAFKGRNEDVRTIGEQLSVSYVLEGSVRKNKDKIRVTAQLIETGDGFHLWSETYERHLKDIFEIQDMVSQEILEKFRNGLGEPKDESASDVDPFTDNSIAYKAYLEGKFHWERFTIPSISKAAKSFNEAIEADPEFLKAYTSLANCYLFLGVFGQMSARLAFGKAEKVINRALELDNYSAEVQATDGLIKALFHHHYGAAGDAFARAFDINQNMANPYYFYSLFLNIIGKPDQALRWVEKALEIYPTNAFFNAEFARAYYCSRRYSEALEQYNYTLELDSTFLPALEGKGWTYVAMGELKKAHEVFEIYQNLVSQEQKNIPQLVYIAAKLGMDDVAEHFLEVLQLGDESDKHTITPIDIALIYLGMKKYDEVFFHFQRAVDDKIGKVLFINSDPIWDEIKQDARYQKLLKDLNLLDINGIQKYDLISN